VILLDTHALIWWVDGVSDRLSPLAAAAITAELQGGKILVSSISAWEIAMLVARGRLSLGMDVATWLSKVEAIDSLEFVPVDNEIGENGAPPSCPPTRRSAAIAMSGRSGRDPRRRERASAYA
jgi:PIN domain nuclease of toxin-antitoxin system